MRTVHIFLIVRGPEILSVYRGIKQRKLAELEMSRLTEHAVELLEHLNSHTNNQLVKNRKSGVLGNTDV